MCELITRASELKSIKPDALAVNPHTYEKEITCPICGNIHKEQIVRSHSAKMTGKHSDFFIEYSVINPYFYDIWLCPSCGFAAMKKEFEAISKKNIDLIKQKISKNWVTRKYPKIFNVDTAIERYKMALLNYCATESRESQKGYICLKLSWMYRIKGDKEKEQYFMVNAKDCLTEAYLKEEFPIYGMDIHTMQYLIGELHRRLKDADSSLRWFSEVIASRDAAEKVKDMARDQRDLIKRERASV